MAKKAKKAPPKKPAKLQLKDINLDKYWTLISRFEDAIYRLQHLQSTAAIAAGYAEFYTGEAEGTDCDAIAHLERVLRALSYDFRAVLNGLPDSVEELFVYYRQLRELKEPQNASV